VHGALAPGAHRERRHAGHAIVLEVLRLMLQQMPHADTESPSRQQSA
jgi:hypothetical protein